MSSPTKTRADQIVAFVHEQRKFIWDAYDQGRWAHATGCPRSICDHLEGHVNYSDWRRGWDDEARAHGLAA